MLTIESAIFGPQYTPEATVFTVYATHCTTVEVCLYTSDETLRFSAYQMKEVGENIWSLSLSGDQEGQFYTYRIQRGVKRFMACDPFALSSSMNSKRSAIVDLEALKPEGFDGDTFIKVPHQEAILYEAHIRDLTMHPDHHIGHKGKYLGVLEQSNEPYHGLDHIVDVGFTHLHLLPLQDFLSVDESRLDQYNWGYDPEQYFVPEGSYATNPKDPKCRIFELRQMVQGIHQKGLGLVLDVVYNHTYRGGENPLEILAPGTYYRMEKGYFSNGSGCGNELRTEHPMTRRLILDSLTHWMKVYHFDGFRFDLMALMDVETAQRVAERVREINPYAVLYGEPWTGAQSALPHEQMMLKGKQRDLKIAFFNDDYRNALKGDSDGKDHGLIQGYKAKLYDVKTGIVGSIAFSQHHTGFCYQPWETVNYLSAHDNLILFDKLKHSTMWPDDQIKEATKAAFSLIMLAFGLPFVQAGTEFMRSKQMDHNSYKSPDSINAMDWHLREKHEDLVQHLKDLIQVRRYLGCYDAFDEEDIRNRVILNRESNFLVYKVLLKGHDMHQATVVINTTHEAYTSKLILRKSCQIIYDGSQRDWKGLPQEPYLSKKRLLVKPYQTLVITSPKGVGGRMSF